MTESIIQTRYEVLSKDGAGHWHRLSQHDTLDEANQAMKRYSPFYGIRIDRVESVRVMSYEKSNA